MDGHVDEEEAMVLLMRHRYDYVTPERKVRLHVNSVADAGNELARAAHVAKGRALDVAAALAPAAEQVQHEVAEWAAAAKAAVDLRAAALLVELDKAREA
eukprot:COSAG01_NODE_27632_length_680_cov_5.984509_2_plen_99_part_01